MNKLIINSDNISDSVIDETATRVKAIIINSHDEILLGYAYDIYQFPGGHVEEGEELVPALKRELQEETGLSFDLTNAKPFFAIESYVRNYRGSGKNRLNYIYYFGIRTDRIFDLKQVNYDKREKDGNYQLRYVKAVDFENVLKESINKNATEINRIIVEEMLEAFKRFKFIV